MRLHKNKIIKNQGSALTEPKNDVRYREFFSINSPNYLQINDKIWQVIHLMKNLAKLNIYLISLVVSKWQPKILICLIN